MTRKLSICIINPRFHPSFWGHEFALPILPGDRRCWIATGALPLLAALIPAGHDVEVIDENVDTLDFESLRRHDVIGLTGMIVQRERMFEILDALKGFRAVVVVGGPYASVSPSTFAGRANAVFVGEAEETWPEFLNTVADGRPFAPIYQQREKTDMTLVPAPRFELLKTKHYFAASVQFSRGCPFSCEFCDIITIYGRKPRTKTPAQLIAELDRVCEAGFRSCSLVDDNFIGNRVAAKAMLPELIAWQRRNGYPLNLSTEASIDLAEYPELIDLMVEANILSVFIGIESPRYSSLEETRKHQNTRGDTLLAKISRIRDGGLVISSGFIVGFDSDDKRIFDEQYTFIQGANLAQAMPAVLFPVPTTPLYARLAAEGRLDESNPEIAFQPKQMTREELRSGHRQLLLRLYDPAAYFERVIRGYRQSPAFRRRRAALARSIGRRVTVRGKILQTLMGVKTGAKLLVAMARRGCLLSVGSSYVKTYLRENVPLGNDAIPFGAFVQQCVLHWHYYLIARDRRNTAFGVSGTVESNMRTIPLTQVKTHDIIGT